MCIVAAAAIIGTGASIAGSIMGHQAATKQAYQQRLYNAQVNAQNERYRAELIAHQNVVYKQNIDYGGQVLDWKKSEFARQEDMVERAQDGIQKNLFTQYATALQRQVEEQIAGAFQMDTVSRQAQKQRASAQVAADRKGVEGNSIESLIDDVWRQQGDAHAVLELNKSATMRQLNLEMMGLKANADQALYNIPIQTYGPSAPIQAPSPVSPVAPAAPVAMPSQGALIANVVGQAVQGMSNYASWSGQTMRQAFSIR